MYCTDGVLLYRILNVKLTMRQLAGEFCCLLVGQFAILRLLPRTGILLIMGLIKFDTIFEVLVN